jgi:CoA:oxalate CoA-transferase
VVKILRPGESPKAAGAMTVPEAFEWATNRDKRSVEIDLGSEGGRATFLGLVARADVVFNNMRPGSLERLGLGYGQLKAANPRIILCEISGFGETGPWAQMPSYDLIAQAARGSIDITGPHDNPEEPPVRWGIPIGDIAGALYAVIGLLAALAVRDRDGVGQQVSISMLDGLLSLSTYRVPQLFDAGLSPLADQHMGGGGTRPYGPYRCSDGRWIAIGFAKPHWAAACAVMGASELVDDPRFSSERLRNRNKAQLEPIMAELLSRRPAAEWEALFIAAGAPAGRVNTLKEAFSHPQVQARGMIVEIRDEAGRAAHVATDPMGIGRAGRPPVALVDPDRLGWDARPVPASTAGAAPPSKASSRH